MENVVSSQSVPVPVGSARADALADTVAIKDQKLRKAAGEFESMLLANLWKSMKASFAADQEDASDPAHDTLDDWGIQSMSEAVRKNGGLGIGRLILKELEPKIVSQTGK